MTKTRAVVRGVGGYLPERVVTNYDLTLSLDTSDEWIRSRTGIGQRHLAADDECTSDLATKAAQAALENAGMEAADLDLIIVATTTPDHSFPATACIVQKNLGILRGIAFDVQAVCAGFIFAVDIANLYITSGRARNALVIGAETMSRLLNWDDRSTAVLFGDGAGAMILQAQQGTESGILDVITASAGEYVECLYTDGGVSTTGTAGHVQMLGREVYRHAVQKMGDTSQMLLDRLGMSWQEVDWFVPHQANIRIIEAIQERAGISTEKVITTVSHHANTSAASIPLALAEANKKGLLQAGQLVLMTAIGGGLSWGACALRW